MNKIHFYWIELVQSKDESLVWKSILNKVFLKANFIEFSFEKKSIRRDGNCSYLQQIDSVIDNNQHLSVMNDKLTKLFAAKDNIIRLSLTDDAKQVLLDVDAPFLWFFSDYTNPSLFVDDDLVWCCNAADRVLYLRADVCDQELFDIIQDSQLSEVVCDGENIELEKMIVSKY